PVMMIGQQKGHTTSEMMEHNFGMPEPEGYRKGMRLMRYAERFGLPLVTIVDTPGAYPGLGAEERGQSIAISESILLMSRLPVPIVTVVTGEGGSGGALALATSDRVLMMENAYYSVISPEGCSTILFKDAAAAPRAAKALRITSPDLLRLGVMDAVVTEPEGGAQNDPAVAGANLRAALIASLSELLPLELDELLTQRYDRFRRFGAPPGARMASGVFSLDQMTDARIPVLAPLVGTFYGSPKPGEKPFVEVGDTVDAGAPVCIVEAMKMMNEVVASEAGKVAEIAV